jgi:hypothetical protein
MSFISNVLSSGLKTNRMLNAPHAADILQESVYCSTIAVCLPINKSLYEANLTNKVLNDNFILIYVTIEVLKIGD